jgi:23S rRNA pseudouridine1911/1915/1917 synthase
MKLPVLPILFEDNHLLVVDKPAGLLSQADLGGDLDVLTLARAILKQRDGKPGNVYLGLVHRLDRPVSGAMVLAKTSKAASRLARAFRERAARKIYLAVVGGVPEPAGAALSHPLIRDRALRLTRVAAAGGQGREARLAYRVLETRAARSLVEIALETGLQHQIRAQLAAIGHPVEGDRKYGAPGYLDRGPGAIALFARELGFEHPVRRTPLHVTAPPPPHFPWDLRSGAPGSGGSA